MRLLTLWISCTAAIAVLCAVAVAGQTQTHDLRITPEHVHWG